MASSMRILAAFVALGAVASHAIATANDLTDRTDRLEHAAARTYFRDALLGRRLTVDALDANLAGRPSILWIIDLERCPDCLRDAMAWYQLGDLNRGFVNRVIVVGRPSIDDLRLFEAMPELAVLEASRATIESLVGPFLPSSRLVVDERGVVVMADGRRDVRTCKWSFEGQLGHLFSLPSPVPIRSNTSVSQTLQ